MAGAVCKPKYSPTIAVPTTSKGTTTDVPTTSKGTTTDVPTTSKGFTTDVPTFSYPGPGLTDEELYEMYRNYKMNQSDGEGNNTKEFGENYAKDRDETGGSQPGPTIAVPTTSKGTTTDVPTTSKGTTTDVPTTSKGFTTDVPTFSYPGPGLTDEELYEMYRNYK